MQKKGKKGRPRKNVINFVTENNYNFNKKNIISVLSIQAPEGFQNEKNATSSAADKAYFQISQVKKFIDILSTFNSFSNSIIMHFCSNGIYIVSEPKNSKIQFYAYLSSQLSERCYIRETFSIQIDPNDILKKIKNIADTNNGLILRFTDNKDLIKRSQLIMRVSIHTNFDTRPNSEFAEEITYTKYELPNEQKLQNDGIIIMQSSDIIRCFKQIISTGAASAGMYVADNNLCISVSHSNKSYIEKIVLKDSEKIRVLSPVSEFLLINQLQIKDLLKVISKCSKHSAIIKMIFLKDSRIVFEFDCYEFGAINYIVNAV